MARRDDGDDRGWFGGTGAPVDRIEPGDPAPENVAFVLLGAMVTLVAFGHVAGLV